MFPHSTKGRLLDNTPIDLAEMREITNPNRRESLLPWCDRTVSIYGSAAQAESRWDGLLAKLLLQTPLDMPVLAVYLSVTVTTVASAIGLICAEYTDWLPRVALHAWGCAHLAVTLAGNTEGFALALHYSSHRRIWKKQWGWMDWVVHHLYAPLFGIPSGAYCDHHLIMHHKENNQLDYDASSTLSYQRDSPSHLLLHIVRYMVGIWVELPAVLVLRERYSTACKLMCYAYGYCCFLMWAVHQGSLSLRYVLAVPFVIMSVCLTRGNWIQHLFVSPDAPSNNFKQAYALVNSPVNEGTFNDGFHIEHHIFPQCHWTELPMKFLSILPKHKDGDSFIFTGLTGDDVWNFASSGNLEKLADHYVYIGQPSGTSKEVLVAEMRRRLVPISESSTSRKTK
jgi:fatty acid desaturase